MLQTSRLVYQFQAVILRTTPRSVLLFYLLLLHYLSFCNEHNRKQGRGKGKVEKREEGRGRKGGRKERREEGREEGRERGREGRRE